MIKGRVLWLQAASGAVVCQQWRCVGAVEQPWCRTAGLRRCRCGARAAGDQISHFHQEFLVYLVASVTGCRVPSLCSVRSFPRAGSAVWCRGRGRPAGGAGLRKAPSQSRCCWAGLCLLSLPWYSVPYPQLFSRNAFLIK